MTDQDQEVTLGTGRLLGLFFGLVIICALFFSLGFSLGHRNFPEPAAAATILAPAVPTTNVKPSPVRTDLSKPDCTTPGACPPDNAGKSTSDELTFYKAVEQNAPQAKLETPDTPQSPGKAAEFKPAALPAPVRATAPASAPSTTARTMGAGFMVQVAAVSKQEDAEALVNALRRKNYPVITTNSPNDKLYHVQVGPFPDLADAESTRSKLISDGYNPILKK